MKTFPLMAWNWPPADRAVLQKMRECGLTVAGFVRPQDLDLCQAVGLKAIVADPRANNYDWQKVNKAVARRRIAALVKATGKHPALLGYYLIDEPHSRFFGGLGKVAALVREYAPHAWPYINLFPNYADPAVQLGTASYQEYVAKFIATCRPPIVSYDHYALMNDGTLRDGYWQNLETTRATGLPFWNIVLSVAHFHYREATAADLRFQVFSTLAYGARGIAYFTYFTPAVGNYRLAPIDQFGNPTPTWSMLQNVNLQIAQLAPTLLQLTSDVVYHWPPGPQSLFSQDNPDVFMAGEFTHRDRSRYALIVNKSFTQSHPCNPQFRQQSTRVQMVSPYTGQLIDFTGEHKWLAPGQGVLLRIT